MTGDVLGSGRMRAGALETAATRSNSKHFCNVAKRYTINDLLDEDKDFGINTLHNG